MPEFIQVEHFYLHPPAAVWKALTDPALHARWWAVGDVRAVVGHRFHLHMGTWGKQPCEVLQVEQERLLQYRFAAGSLDTIIIWELIPEGRGTRLKLTHEGFNLDSPISRRAFEGMKPGWPQMLLRLERILETGSESVELPRLKMTGPNSLQSIAASCTAAIWQFVRSQLIRLRRGPSDAARIGEVENVP